MYSARLNKADRNLAPMSLRTRSASKVLDHTASSCVIQIIAPIQAKIDEQSCELCPEKVGS